MRTNADTDIEAVGPSLQQQASVTDRPADNSGRELVTILCDREQQQIISALSERLRLAESELVEKDRTIQELTRGLNEKNAQFNELTHTLGGFLTHRFLSLYSFYRRIRYPYLLPLYKLFRVTPPAPNFATNEKSDSFPPVKPPAALMPHLIRADIVVCIHNALADVRRCLESVVRNTSQPYSLILVDDGSDEECQTYLKDFGNVNQAILVRNVRARGYTLAANQGLRQSTSEYVVLLNSDTIVTPGWLDRMIACGESDSHIGLVGPLSNAATWQSIPEIIIDGEFAENTLPQGATAADMGELVAQYSSRLYPRVPFLNGFCLMIRRSVIKQIGFFDEDYFGKGYGEENDYSVRARQAGWQLAVADDAYVYHAQSRSYSHERRKRLSQEAGKALEKKWGRQIVDQGVTACRWDRVMEGVRARNRVMMERRRFIEKGSELWKGKNILFQLPGASVSGGINVVLDEAEAMRSMGVDVTILNESQNRHEFKESYPDNSLPMLYVNSASEIPALLADYDAVISTASQSVEWNQVQNLHHRPTIGYYIQDFEPDFYPKGSQSYQKAWASYTRDPDQIRVTKTQWNQAIVKEKIGVDCTVIGPSVNIDLHRPRVRRDPDWPGRPLRIAAMIRPCSHHRAATLTLEILREVFCAHRNAVEIVLFGCEPQVLRRLEVRIDFPYRLFGILVRPHLAALLNEIDIFVDFSKWQAMGLTAMEAMCYGAAVIVPRKGGAHSFLKNEENGLMVNTKAREECLSALDRLVVDAELRERLQRRALVDICHFYRERAAFNILRALFSNVSNEQAIIDLSVADGASEIPSLTL